MHLIIPKDYNPVLNTRDTEIAIKLVKDFFERELARQLNLTRVSAPIMVTPQSGLNDNLNGVERPVDFDILETGERAEIVHSLAKWKRMALKTYGFAPGEGLYTDMNAIRRDEITDNIHSIFVDQWDWERILTPQERNEATLRAIVEKIYETLQATEDHVCAHYPHITPSCPSTSPLSPPRNWRTGIPTKPARSGNTWQPRSTARCSSWALAARCAPAKSTTAVPPTMTIGP